MKPVASASLRTLSVAGVVELDAGALALLRENEHKHGMQCGPDWFALLEREVFGAADGVQWLVLKSGEHTLAVWPLRRRDGAGAMSNYYSAIYSPAHAQAVSRPQLQTLATSLRSLRLGRGVLDFAPMDSQSPEFEALEAALSDAGLKTFRYFRFGNWYLPCAGMTWEAYLASRRANQRSTIRRMVKKLAADGGHVQIVTGPAGVDEAILAYRRVYAASWKQPEPHSDFPDAMLRLCAARGWLRLGIAWLGDLPIAAQIWTVAHGRAEIFKVAYDEAYKSYTPGTVVSAALMEHVLTKDEVSEVDFLIGDDDYKRQWMSHRRERWGIVAYDPLTVRGAWGLARETAARLVKRWRVRSQPTAAAAADQTKS
jgi:Acetyltransferase (GNAT) domain